MLQFFTGILMSSVHVVTGPDHLAAVTPLAIENRKKAWHIHSHHVHPHYHATPAPQIHIHLHEHENEFEHIHEHQKTTRQNSVTALLVGTLHGFAGISHFLLILPTLALPSMQDSVFYLSGFAVGTIITMVSYAVVLGLVAQKTADFPKSKIFRNIRIVAGSLAIAVGIWWLI
jgi:ABC-type nickel/cobalt efflux system permease component RcnA